MSLEWGDEDWYEHEDESVQHEPSEDYELYATQRAKALKALARMKALEQKTMHKVQVDDRTCVYSSNEQRAFDLALAIRNKND